MARRVLVPPAQRRLEVVVLGLEAIEPRDLLGPAAPALGLLRQGQEPRRCRLRSHATSPAATACSLAVLPDRLQQPIAGDGSRGVASRR